MQRIYLRQSMMVYRVCSGATVASGSSHTNVHPDTDAALGHLDAADIRFMRALIRMGHEDKIAGRQGGLVRIGGLEEGDDTYESADEDESDDDETDDDGDEEYDEDEQVEFPRCWPEGVLELLGDSISGTVAAHGPCGVYYASTSVSTKGDYKDTAKGSSSSASRLFAGT
jgi:hypothetical protein